MTVSAYTTYRAALQATLTAGLPSYAFYAGMPPGGRDVPDSTAVGYVWVDHAQPDSNNKLVEVITCGVRLYVIFTQLEDQLPVDPTLLEQAAEDVQTVLAPAQTPGDPWYYEVVAISFDHANGYVEAEVMGTRWNDFAVS